MSLTASAVYQLAYVSEANADLSYQDIDSILKASVNRNNQNEITGLLIYRDGFFIQFLEGVSEQSIKETLERIMADKRHGTVRVIGEWQSPKRLFENWQMGFFDSDLHEDHPQKSCLEQLFGSTKLVALPKPQELLSYFMHFVRAKIELK